MSSKGEPACLCGEKIPGRNICYPCLQKVIDEMEEILNDLRKID